MLLRDLLAMRDLRLRLLTGTDHVAFQTINCCELPNHPYVRPGDLVLTGLTWHRQPADSDTFAAALADAGVVAVGAGEATVSEIPEDLVAACQRHGVPLLAVPADIPFSLVVSRVAVSADLVRQRRFAALLAHSGDLVTAVAQGVGLAHAVSLLAADTDLSCHVLTPTGRVIASSSPLDDRQIDTLTRGYLTVQRLPARIGRRVPWTVAAAAAEPGHRLAGWLVACSGDHTTWPEATAEAVRTLRAAAGLERARLDRDERLRRRVFGELVGQLLTSGVSATTVVQRLRDIGFADTTRYRLAVAQAPECVTSTDVVAATLDDAARHLAEDPVTVCHDTLAVAAIPYCDDAAGTQTMPVPVPDAPAGSGEAGRVLAAAFGRAAPGFGPGRVAVGLSALATAEELTGLLDQARYACAVAEARRERVSVVTSDELASHTLLLAMVPDQARRMFADRVLRPVLAHDAAHHGHLMPTLRTYLECHGSWTECARQMNLHPNSVRYRLHQIERLTGRKLGRTEDMVDLYLAIQARAADPASKPHSGHGE
jgi:PucR C-terminal helix-turn-helix domain/Purine catabolism regulatory protein-like family